MEPLVLLLLLMLIALVWDVCRARRLTKGCRLPPGPTRWPLLGFLHRIDAEAPYLKLTELSRKYGKVFSVWMGSLPCVVIADAAVMKRCFAKRAFAGRAPLDLVHGIMRGRGLICAEGRLWESQRRFVARFMRDVGMGANSSILQGDEVGRSAREEMDGRVIKHINAFIEELHPTDNKLDPLLSHIVGNMMNEIIFGISYDRDDPLWLEMQHLREEGIKHLAVSGVLNFFPWLASVPLLGKRLNPREWIVAGQRKSHAEYQRIIEEISISSNHKNNDFTNMTEAYLDARQEEGLSNRNHFTDTQLHFLQADIFGAGSDTSAVTIKWCILYLCKHPDVQEELYKQVVEVCGTEKHEISMADQEKLTKIDSFICEVERLRPVVPMGVPHGTTERAEMEGKWVLPKGCMVIPLQWAMNRDPDVWGEDADQFDPFRFINDDGRVVEPEHFLPFQSGRRRCVGEAFGRRMVFLFVSNLLLRLRLRLSQESIPYELEGRKHDHGFTLNPKPFKVDVQKRGKC